MNKDKAVILLRCCGVTVYGTESVYPSDVVELAEFYLERQAAPDEIDDKLSQIKAIEVIIGTVCSLTCVALILCTLTVFVLWSKQRMPQVQQPQVKPEVNLRVPKDFFYHAL